jgi:aminoglycoside 3-N-acetyltransferase
MQSLAVIGKWADDLVGRDTPSAFDTGSAFERLLELDSKLLLLGADIQAVSMVHYSEQRAQVPYRFWKEFTGPVQKYPKNSSSSSDNTKHGQVIKTYRMFVRDMAIDPKLDLSPIQNELEKRGLWHSVTINYGKISSCLLSDFVTITDELLHADPWVLVSNRPVRKYRKYSSASSAPSHQAEDG